MADRQILPQPACPCAVFGDTLGDADATTSDPARSELPGTSAARVSSRGKAEAVQTEALKRGSLGSCCQLYPLKELVNLKKPSISLNLKSWNILKCEVWSNYITILGMFTMPFAPAWFSSSGFHFCEDQRPANLAIICGSETRNMMSFDRLSYWNGQLHGHVSHFLHTCLCLIILIITNNPKRKWSWTMSHRGGSCPGDRRLFAPTQCKIRTPWNCESTSTWRFKQNASCCKVAPSWLSTSLSIYLSISEY